MKACTPLVLLSLTIGLPLIVLAHHGSPAEILPVSQGVYRLPFIEATEVRVTSDHVSHNPHNRLDMGKVGPDLGTIVSAGAGWVEYIQDGWDLTCPKADEDNPNPCAGYDGPSGDCCVRGTPGCDCRNNYVWIRHANGEWTKYTHMLINTVPDYSIGDWVPAGAILGAEGDTGYAGGVHLHLEVVVPDVFDLSIAP